MRYQGFVRGRVEAAWSGHDRNLVILFQQLQPTAGGLVATGEGLTVRKVHNRTSATAVLKKPEHCMGKPSALHVVSSSKLSAKLLEVVHEEHLVQVGLVVGGLPHDSGHAGWNWLDCPVAFQFLDKEARGLVGINWHPIPPMD